MKSSIPLLNHAVVTTIDRNLSACCLAEEWAGNGGDHATDIVGLDLSLLEVAEFLLLKRHIKALGRALKVLSGSIIWYRRLPSE
jgi:hypothetical protein